MTHAFNVRFQAVHNAQLMEYLAKSASKGFILFPPNVNYVLGIADNVQAVLCAQNSQTSEVES